LSSRILKYTDVKVDEENVVSIDVVPQRKQNEEESDELEAEDIEAIGKRCEQILTDAKDKAEQILAEAKITGEKLAEEAQKKAYNEGYTEGYQFGLAETNKMKEEVERYRQESVDEREETLKSIEPQLVELIQDILHKLLSDEVVIDPRVIIYLIRDGLSAVSVKGDVTIHVSAEDYEAVQQNKDMFASLVDSSSNIDIVSDISLNKSDCFIETVFGTIDCSLDQQYEALKNDLYLILKSG